MAVTYTHGKRPTVLEKQNPKINLNITQLHKVVNVSKDTPQPHKTLPIQATIFSHNYKATILESFFLIPSFSQHNINLLTFLTIRIQLAIKFLIHELW